MELDTSRGHRCVGFRDCRSIQSYRASMVQITTFCPSKKLNVLPYVNNDHLQTCQLSHASTSSILLFGASFIPFIFQHKHILPNDLLQNSAQITLGMNKKVKRYPCQPNPHPPTASSNPSSSWSASSCLPVYSSEHWA
jgi:hypothetical protein